VFATFKINSHFERIGDHAKGIARYALELDEPYQEKIIADLNLMAMYELVDSMITDISGHSKKLIHLKHEPFSEKIWMLMR